MADQWWGDSEGENQDQAKPSVEFDSKPFFFKANGNSGVPTMAVMMVLSFMISGYISEFAEDLVFEEEQNVYSYYDGECTWEGGMDEMDWGANQWGCKDQYGVESGYWDSEWYYCENQWGNNWFCTDDFGQDPEFEFSADMERLIDYRMKNTFYYVSVAVVFAMMFSLLLYFFIVRDKNWTSIEIHGNKVILRRWLLPLKLKSITYKELEVSNVSEVIPDMVWVDTTSSTHNDHI